MSEGPTTNFDPSQVTVLIADDEPDNLAMLQRALRGYPMVVAKRADQALELLAEHHVDIVVTDERMPGGSGAEVLKRTREKNPLARRVIISAHVDAATLMDAINRGSVERYLVKPVAATYVRKVVDELAADYLALVGEKQKLADLEEAFYGEAERRSGLRRQEDREENMAYQLEEIWERLDHEIARAKRYDRTLSIMVAQDQPGLRVKLTGVLRAADAVLGFGEEILILLPETDSAAASIIVERLGSQGSDAMVRAATYPDDASDARALVAVAR